MKKKLNYFNAEERNGLVFLLFIVLLFSVFIFLQTRVLPEPAELEIVYASFGKHDRSVDARETEMNSHERPVATEELKGIPVSIKEMNKTDLKNAKRSVFTSYKDHDVKMEGSVKSNALQKKVVTSKGGNYNSWNDPRLIKKKNKNDFPAFSINSQSSQDWEQIYGIGPGYAARIIKYQKWLGGFHSKEQIKEVYGLSDSLYNTFESKLLPSKPYRLIDINQADEKTIGKHPYLSWKEAKTIVRYRKHHFPISKKKFMALKGISDESKNKILPYLTFHTTDTKNEVKMNFNKDSTQIERTHSLIKI